jgi:hypothetical protein
MPQISKCCSTNTSPIISVYPSLFKHLLNTFSKPDHLTSSHPCGVRTACMVRLRLRLNKLELSPIGLIASVKRLIFDTCFLARLPTSRKWQVPSCTFYLWIISRLAIFFLPSTLSTSSRASFLSALLASHAF